MVQEQAQAYMMMSSKATADLQWFCDMLANQQLVTALRQIDTILCDIDGTLTDGQIYVNGEHEDGRNFSILDGYIINAIKEAGLRIILVSGKSHASAMVRARVLGIDLQDCIVGRCDKPTWLREQFQKGVLQQERVMMFGDDLVDANCALEKVVALYVAPANAPFYLQALADVVVPREGGQHSFRLLMDLWLYVRGVHPVQQTITQAIACPKQG